MNVKNKMTVTIAVIVLIVLALNMITYQVRFNEVAVVTTQGRASEDSIIRGDDESAGLLGNLHFKLPPPFQTVVWYDTRLQVIESRLEEQQTLDKHDIVASVFVTWRVGNPLDFYKTLRTPKEAEKVVRDQLRDAKSILGTYDFADLTNTDPTKLKLAEAEKSIADQLRARMASGAAGGSSYGIEIESVGIRQIVLPEPVTSKVFEKMKATRNRLASSARFEGKSRATDIEAKAESDKERILSFARRRADAIRAEGDAAAAEYFKVFQQDEDFAIFLRKLEAYKAIFKHNTTFMIDANEGGLGSEFGSEMLTPMMPKKASQ